MTLSKDQIQKLDAPLDRNAVKQRDQAGRTLSYIEGWHAIAEANRIFGFDAWSSETAEIKCVAENPRTIGRDKRQGFGVSYIAKVRVTIDGVVREGVGSGHGIDADLGLAHESAIKEAETDARKRALMTFGNPFGLALYDKTQANVAPVPAEDERSPGEVYAEQILATVAKTGADELMPMWKGVVAELKKLGHAFDDDPIFISLKEAFAARRTATMKAAA